jgi:hypothetical protein
VCCISDDPVLLAFVMRDFSASKRLTQWNE